MTVSNSRRTRQRVYRIGLLVSALWLLVTIGWLYVVVLALRGVDVDASPLEQLSAFDRYETNITRGAIIASTLFSIRVIMFLQWPDARLLRPTWRG